MNAIGEPSRNGFARAPTLKVGKILALWTLRRVLKIAVGELRCYSIVTEIQGFLLRNSDDI